MTRESIGAVAFHDTSNDHNLDMIHFRLVIAILSLALCSPLSILYAQDLRLTIVPGEEFSFSRRDEWKLVIQNPTKLAVRAYLEGTVREAKKGLIYHSRSSVRDFLPGTETITTAYYPGLKPFTSLKDDGTLTEPALRTNAFPAGDYEICVYAFAESDGKEISRTCYSFSWDQYSSLILIQPHDADTVRERFPLLSWHRLSPITTPTIRYELSVYELQNQQTPVAAVQVNAPYYTTTSDATIHMYPLSARTLNATKRYAWRVVALQGKKRIAESDVWSFVYQPDTSEDSTAQRDSTKRAKNLPLPGIAYSEVVPEAVANSRVSLGSATKGVLHVLIRHNSTSPRVALRIVAADGRILLTRRVDLHYGANYLSLPLKTWTKDVQSGFYELQIVDVNGTIQKLRFRNDD